MKVLVINTVTNKGGAAKIAYEIHNSDALKTNNIDSNFAFGRGRPYKEGSKKEFKISKKFEVYTSFLLTRLFGIEGMGAFLSTASIKRFIKKNDIALVHLHNIHGYYINLSIVEYLKKKEIPVIWTLHDAWSFTGSCAYFYDCNKWKSECENCENLHTYPKNLVDNSKRMFKIKNRVFNSKKWNVTLITPSEWLGKIVKKSFLSKQDIVTINNGVDFNIFKPYDRTQSKKKYGLDENKKIVLFIAHDIADERKGIKYLLDASEKINMDDVLIVSVGNSDTELDKLSNFIQIGYVNSKIELAMIYSMADVFCIPSLDDNFPTTILEALACDTPVIGFNVGGISEQILPGCGKLINNIDSDCLADGIKEILNTTYVQGYIRGKAEEQFSKEIMIDKYIDLYKKKAKFI